MTQKEIAKQIGIPEISFSYLLNGHRKVGPRYAQKIATFLKRPDWQTFYHMPGPELRRELTESINGEKHERNSRSRDGS